MSWFDEFLDAGEELLEDGLELAGDIVDEGSEILGDGLEYLGADGAAEMVRDAGDFVANELGATPDEAALGEADDPKDLVHGEPGQMRDRAGKLEGLAANFEKGAVGLRAISVGEFSGETADAYDRKVGEEFPKWFTAADACLAGAAALNAFAPIVESAQRRAADAIAKWNEGTRLHEQHVQAINNYNAALARGADVLPPRPPDVDPGLTLKEEAVQVLNDARKSRNEGAAAAAAAFRDAAADAPPLPSASQRLAANLYDFRATAQMFTGHFGIGVASGFSEMGKMLRTLNPVDPYNLAHPADYQRNATALGAAVSHMAANPDEAVESLLLEGWSDPGQKLGEIVSEAAGTKGAGAVVKAPMKVAGRMADGPGGAGRMADGAGDAGATAARHVPEALPDSGPETPSASLSTHTDAPEAAPVARTHDSIAEPAAPEQVSHANTPETPHGETASAPEPRAVDPVPTPESDIAPAKGPDPVPDRAADGDSPPGQAAAEPQPVERTPEVRSDSPPRPASDSPPPHSDSPQALTPDGRDGPDSATGSERAPDERRAADQSPTAREGEQSPAERDSEHSPVARDGERGPAARDSDSAPVDRGKPTEPVRATSDPAPPRSDGPAPRHDAPHPAVRAESNPAGAPVYSSSPDRPAVHSTRADAPAAHSTAPPPDKSRGSVTPEERAKRNGMDVLLPEGRKTSHDEDGWLKPDGPEKKENDKGREPGYPDKQKELAKSPVSDGIPPEVPRDHPAPWERIAIPKEYLPEGREPCFENTYSEPKGEEWLKVREAAIKHANAERHDYAQAKEDNRPRVSRAKMAAALEMPDGKIFPGLSGRVDRVDLSTYPELEAVIREIPKRYDSQFNWECAELQCITDALKEYTLQDLQGARSSAAKIRGPNSEAHGAWKEACLGDKVLLSKLGIAW